MHVDVQGVWQKWLDPSGFAAELLTNQKSTAQTGHSATFAIWGDYGAIFAP
jgi:hypothetical protein